MNNPSLLKKNIVALIPLRGGSKSIPRKNIKEIAGKPLCAWVLESASNAKLINNVYVSTDSEEIKAVVESLNLGVKVIFRPKNLATDEASTESVMINFMSQVDFDIIVTIQATSPLLCCHELDQALKVFNSDNLNSMLSAVRTKRFFWTEAGAPINYNPKERPLRQNFAGTMMENGAFYITDRTTLKNTNCRLGGKIGVFEMPDNTAVEIDEPSDWKIVKNLLELKKINDY
jgi:CMP-N-acetylneuraminic acid synthetase